MSRLLIALVILAVPCTAQYTLVSQGTFNQAGLFASNGAIGVCFDSTDSTIWGVDSSGPPNLYHFDLAGTPIAPAAINTGAAPFVMPSPNGITQDRSTNDLWLVDNTGTGGSNVMQVTQAGAYVGSFFIPTAGSNPVSITYNTVTGNLWVGATGGLHEFDLVGNPLSVITTGGPLAGSIISGLTYYPPNNTFFVAIGSSLWEVDMAGNVLSTTDLSGFGIVGAQGCDYDPVTSLLLIVDNTLTDYQWFTIAPACQLSIGGTMTPMGWQIDVNNLNCTPGASYFTCITLNIGNYPGGYWFGISPTLIELGQQLQLPLSPFQGTLDMTGSSNFSVTIPGPIGVTAYGVTVEIGGGLILASTQPTSGGI